MRRRNKPEQPSERAPERRTTPRAQPIRIIPLGGVGEIGKNMSVYEYGNDIVIVDGGLMFPDEEMLGVDLVIPDVTYLQDKLDRIRGVFITHGHEDHIGGLPYLLPQLGFPPVYASKLTIGLIGVKLRERRILDRAHLEVVEPGKPDPRWRVRRSSSYTSTTVFPTRWRWCMRSPAGIVVNTGDYKIDYTPIDEPADLSALARIGDEGVLVLCGDSTRVESEGHTPSERAIGQTFDDLIAGAEGRVIVATFASLISRVQQVVDAAVQHGRQVALVGRSMVNNAQMAIELGYLRIPSGVLVEVDRIKSHRGEEAGDHLHR